MTLSVSETQGWVVIRVQDDGQGIPDTQMANIFEPFFRVDPSRSKKTGGYGLGLSMCRLSRHTRESYRSKITQDEV